MMTESMLLEIIRKLPPKRVQEVYDFASFLAQKADEDFSGRSDRIEGFSSESEMIDFINDIGTTVYAN